MLKNADALMLTSVPDQYLGLWRRTLLEQQGSQDARSLVLWMQTAQQHADIRIPEGRPDFSNCHELQDCSQTQLKWLATQQGFTGTTQIKNSICQWHRTLDFQPTNGTRDIGDMVFHADDFLLETGIDTPYFEVWKKVPQSQLNVGAQQRTGLSRHGVAVTAYLLTAGKHFAYVRPRSVAMPVASNLLAAMEGHQENLELWLDWLDFEISFGEIVTQNSGFIQHSTLPFREGAEMELS